MVGLETVEAALQEGAALKSKVPPVLPKLLNYSRLEQPLADFSSVRRAALHLV